MASWWETDPTKGLSLNPLSWTGLGVAGEAGAFGSGGLFGSGQDGEEAARKKLLQEQAAAAGGFANRGERDYGRLGREGDAARDALRQQAEGKNLISAEMLRQGLGQQLSQQRSMAAGMGSPMAARTAANNMARASYGMSGQAAIAGMQEQQAAQQALMQAILQQRAQDLQAALGSRQTAVSGFGAGQVGAPEKSFLEKNGPAIAAGLGLLSDERLKTNIKGADKESSRIAEALASYSYDYKDPKHGKGRQVGIMAQDLERVGLGQAVMETSEGKAVHAGKLAGANTAMIGALARRVRELESAAKPRKKGR